MILSDVTLKKEIEKGNLVITPFDTSCVQPASIDLRLSNEFRIFKHTNHALIDIKENFGEYTELLKIDQGEKF
ncbi:MAG: dCTP deaminase, partial [Candidatus Micrarchaeota archaeon]|nr:dCTP deaminase [Candidatus Micrarchaeota archaeon]